MTWLFLLVWYLTGLFGMFIVIYPDWKKGQDVTIDHIGVSLVFAMMGVVTLFVGIMMSVPWGKSIIKGKGKS